MVSREKRITLVGNNKIYGNFGLRQQRRRLYDEQPQYRLNNIAKPSQQQLSPRVIKSLNVIISAPLG